MTNRRTGFTFGISFSITYYARISGKGIGFTSCFKWKNKIIKINTKLVCNMRIE